MRRIGVLANLAEDDLETRSRNAVVLQGLQELGWIEGRNVRIDYRFALGNMARLRQYAAELVALAPDVILAMIKSTPTKIIAQGTDWRFFNELKRELKS